MSESVGRQFDISLYASFRNYVGFGALYRPNNSFAPFLKVTFLQSIHVAYCYDMSLTLLNRYAGPTHELMLKYTLPLKPQFKNIEIDPRYY